MRRRLGVLIESGGRKYHSVDIAEDLANIHHESIMDVSLSYEWIYVGFFTDLEAWSRSLTVCLLSVDLPPSQIVRVGFCAKRWEDGAEEIGEVRKYVRRKLGAVLRGEEIDPSEPPPLEVSCTHFSGVGRLSSRCVYAIAHGRVDIVRADPGVRLGRTLLLGAAKQTKARPPIHLEDISEHSDLIPPQDFPAI